MPIPGPGWHKHPDGTIRWWDGEQWTERVKPRDVPWTDPSKPRAAKSEGTLGCLSAIGGLVVLTLIFGLVKSCGLLLDSDMTFSCSDVSWLYDDVQEAGEKESTSENISELLDKQADLAEAEQDCEDKGEVPDYDGPLH